MVVGADGVDGWMGVDETGLVRWMALMGLMLLTGWMGLIESMK